MATKMEALDSTEEKVVYMSSTDAMKKQLELVQQLPDNKSWPFTIGPLAISINAGVVGVISNSFFRRMLMVRKALLLSSIPMVLMPSLVMTPSWMYLLSKPILLGDLQCTVCADIRGGIVAFILGSAYPFILAAPLNASLARRYETIKVPTLSFKNFDFAGYRDFWTRKARYFKGQFITIAIFQIAFGMYLANSQMRVVREELNGKLRKV